MGRAASCSPGSLKAAWSSCLLSLPGVSSLWRTGAQPHSLAGRVVKRVVTCVLISHPAKKLKRMVLIVLGEGNGNPLQCSSMENPMDRGTWRATVYGVAKCQTRFSKYTHILKRYPVTNAITGLQRDGEVKDEKLKEVCLCHRTQPWRGILGCLLPRYFPATT